MNFTTGYNGHINHTKWKMADTQIVHFVTKPADINRPPKIQILLPSRK